MESLAQRLHSPAMGLCIHTHAVLLRWLEAASQCLGVTWLNGILTNVTFSRLKI